MSVNQWRVHYEGKFKDERDKDYSVQILSQAAPPSLVPKKINIVSAEIIATDNKIEDVIFGRGFEFDIMVDEDDTIKEVFHTSPKSTMVMVKRGNQVIFKGFIDPVEFEEPLLAYPYTVSLSAADGLSSLEDYKYEHTYGVFIKGLSGDFISIDRLINYCLSRTMMHDEVNGNQYNIKTKVQYNVGIESCVGSDYPLTTKEVLEEVVVNIKALSDQGNAGLEFYSCKEILEKLGKVFNFRIYHVPDNRDDYNSGSALEAGVWRVERWNDIKNNRGVMIDSSSCQWVNSKQIVRTESPYGSQTIDVKTKLYDNLVGPENPLGILDSDKDNMEGREFTLYRNFFYNNIQERFGEVEFGEFMPNKPDNIRVTIHHTYTKGSIATWAVGQKCPCSMIQGSNFNLSFKLILVLGHNNAHDWKFRIPVQIRFGDRYYLNIQQDSDDEFSYSILNNSPCWNWIYFTAEGPTIADGEIDIDFNFFPQSIIGDKPLGGYLSDCHILIGGASAQTSEHGGYSDAFSWVKSTTIDEIQMSVEQSSEPDNQWTATLQEDYKREAPSLELEYVDPHPLRSDLNNEKFVDMSIVNAFYYDVTDGFSILPLRGWRRTGDTDYIPITSFRLRDSFDQYAEKRVEISGDVRCYGIGYDIAYYSHEFDSDRFALMGYTQDLMTGISEVRFLQIRDKFVDIV